MISQNNIQLFADEIHIRFIKKTEKIVKSLKIGIWVYLFFVVFEGALRKWFLPGLSTPLLVIRDPIAIWIVLTAWNHKLLPNNLFVTTATLVGFVGVITTLFFGHGNFVVALYGARILFFHFPLIFVIGKIFTREDVIKAGKIALWLSLPFTILISLQFFSPQSAWVNRGVGGDEAGAGFAGALGFARPSGVFSFTNGNSAYYGLVANFIFYFWVEPQKISKFLIISSSVALLITIPFSISRTLFFDVAIAFIFALYAVLMKSKNKGRIFTAIIGVAFIFAILSQTSFFQTSTAAFTARFSTANESEGGLQGVFLDRYLGGLIGALSQTADIPYFGYGLGMGTNVGSTLLTGRRMFLVAEGEWGRLIGELGPLLGIIVIFIRTALGIEIASKSYNRLSTADFLPWGLLSYAILIIPQGPWAQPTALGFNVIIGGLILAAINDNNAEHQFKLSNKVYSYIKQS